MTTTEVLRKTVSQTKKQKGILKKVIYQAAFFGLGFLFSFSGFSEEFAPFGVSFASAVSKKYYPASFLGVCLGYIINFDSVVSLRYVSSLLALTVILGALRPFKLIRDHIITPAVSVFLCLLVTGLAIVFSKDIGIPSVLLCFCEALLGGASSYLFRKSMTVLLLKGSLYSLTSKEATSLMIGVSLLLLALRNIHIWQIYPAHILSMFAILLCAYYGREAGGAVVGICNGIALSFGSGNVMLLAFFSFGGLLAGVLSRLSKVASFCAFFLSGVTVTVMAFSDSVNYFLFLETAVAGAIFLFMPKKFSERCAEILTPTVHSPIIESVKTDIMKRLQNASEISNEISESLTDVSSALVKNEKAELSDITKKTRECVCGSCGLYDACWKESFEETQDHFNTLTCLKKEGVYLEYKTVPSRFSSKCIRTENVASSFNKLYEEYKVKEKIENRINEIYSLACMQFVNVSSLLDSLCEKLTEEVRFDMDLAARARAAASGCGFTPVKGCCVIDSAEKLTMELTLKTPEGKFDVGNLVTQLETVTARKLELPEITREGGTVTLLFHEKAELKVVFSGMQAVSHNEKFSGDTYSAFRDGDGRFYGIICDGMGTGMRAAVNSNLAVTLLEKLLKAGFSVEAALSTVNTSLISKSGDECSVTLDLTVVDLYTGHVDFYKCGAPETLVKKNGKLLSVECPSLPLGILKDVSYRKGTGTLAGGDVLLMTSDGVREKDIPYLKNELKAFSGGNVREFTGNLFESLCETQPSKNDDLTVLTLAVTENR